MRSTIISAIACVALAAIVPSDAANQKEDFRASWRSRVYIARPVPSEWLPANPPHSETSLAAFEKFDLRVDPLSVRKFIARFGVPQRYLVSTRENHQDLLIYDLPSGHSVALYVYKPPNDVFGAAIIVGSEGELLRLIK